MNDENCIKYKVYDSKLYDRLTEKYWGKEPRQDIKDYMNFCYHVEEFRAYGEV